MNQQPNHSRLNTESSKLPQGSAESPGVNASRPLHLLFHIPRCAGQTIHNHLSHHAPADVYYRVPKRRGPGRLFLPQYQIADMPDPQRLGVIGGHWVGRSIERAFPDRQIVRSILLRDPVSQFLSHYNYRMMRYLSQELRPYPMEIAYRARQQNFLTHFILHTFAELPWRRLVVMSTAEKYSAANRFLSDFSFVGDHTRCDELIAFLASDLGIPSKAELRNSSEQWLQRVDWKPMTEDDLSPAFINRIKQDNRLDQMLWETWKDAQEARPLLASPDFDPESRIRRTATQVSRLFNQVRRRVRRRGSMPSGSAGQLP